MTTTLDPDTTPVTAGPPTGLERDRVRDHVEAEIAAVAGLINAAHGRLVAAVAQALRTEVWTGYGIRSVEHWLTLQVGVSRHHAEQLVTLARRVAELPVTVQTLTEGAMTLDQAVLVARKVPARYEAGVAEVAARSAVPQLQAIIGRYQFTDTDAGTGTGTATDPDPDPGRGERSTTDDDPAGDDPAGGSVGSAQAAAQCRTWWTEAGRFRLTYDAPADTGALVEQALAEAKDRLFRSGRSGVTTADAFDTLITGGLEQVAAHGPASRVDRYRVYLHLDLDRTGWINAGPVLPAGLRDKLLCDGVVRPLWHRAGRPVNVGRSQRIVPTRTRRLVEDRDRVCRFPGCTSSRHLEVHHRIAWSRGGSTDLDNLMCLCPAHHDALHRAEYVIDGNPDQPDGLTFTDMLGHRIGPRCPTRPADPPPLPPDRYQRPYGERIRLRDVWFEPAPTPTSRN